MGKTTNYKLAENGIGHFLYPSHSPEEEERNEGGAQESWVVELGLTEGSQKAVNEASKFICEHFKVLRETIINKL